FYLPSFTAGVALMILWKALYNPDFGPINATLEWAFRTFHVSALLGHPVTPPQWLQSTRNLVGLHPEHLGFTAQQWGLGARDAIIFMGVWTAIGGNNMLLYLAGLSNIPLELVEAAELDGAGKWAVFRHVTWPQLAPTTFFIVVMSMIGGLQGGFEQARVMTQGGPAGTTTTLAYYIYTKAFEEFQIGYASAVSWVLFAVIFAVTLINWKFGSKELNY
ncbi:MAG TPA: sugar ABC transporter permease, partial [Armatimonadota bacterium]